MLYFHKVETLKYVYNIHPVNKVECISSTQIKNLIDLKFGQELIAVKYLQSLVVLFLLAYDYIYVLVSSNSNSEKKFQTPAYILY